MKRAVLLVGHADKESFNHRLADHYARGFERAGGTIERFNLADLVFDPVLRAGFRQPQALEPDLQRVRTAVEQANHLVWQFPVYWGTPPAVVRGLFDRVFLPGWAFSYKGNNPLPEGLLAGRSARVIFTMDSPWLWYTLVNHRSLHRSFGTASLRFCGLKPVRFTPLHNVRSMKESARQRHCDRIESLGEEDARAK